LGGTVFSCDIDSPIKQRPAYAAAKGTRLNEQLEQISLITHDFQLRNTNQLAAILGNCDRRQLQVALVKR
jgi:hypothetical protein